MQKHKYLLFNKFSNPENNKKRKKYKNIKMSEILQWLVKSIYWNSDFSYAHNTFLQLSEMQKQKYLLFSKF
jgi:hypothetical protein